MFQSTKFTCCPQLWFINRVPNESCVSLLSSDASFVSLFLIVTEYCTHEDPEIRRYWKLAQLKNCDQQSIIFASHSFLLEFKYDAVFNVSKYLVNDLLVIFSQSCLCKLTNLDVFKLRDIYLKSQFYLSAQFFKLFQFLKNFFLESDNLV